VTLLFTDVSGSTSLGETVDPEAYRGLMGEYFELSRSAVERHGGTIEKFVGDAVLAVFGIPDVHEDDALRAVRAAQEIVAGMRTLSERVRRRLGVALDVRTGVNTGVVVAGPARAGGSFATGDAVNTAARLEQAAGPGEVLLGASTYRLTSHAVAVEPVPPVAAKGKAEPLTAYRLLGVATDVPARASRSGPLVSRGEELAALTAHLDEVLGRRRAAVVTVLGPAGIGKSRLCEEYLAAAADRALVLRGRCLSYGAGITWWPLVEVVREVVGLSEQGADAPGHVRSAMAGHPEAEGVTLVLQPFLGAGGAPRTAGETVWALTTLLAHRAAARPLVVAVDDVHWAEPLLMSSIADLVAGLAGSAVQVVCLARPDVHERHPGWLDRVDSAVVTPGPFGAEETAARLAALLGDPVPAEFAAACAERSAGNPLFLEELATHLVEAGLLRRGAGGWELAGPLESTGMPLTLSALISARLSDLPEGDRESLERVSVVGLEATTAQAVALHDDAAAVPARLASLGRRELLLRRVRHDVERWAFHHVLIRDAAYESMPKALRADLHVRLADDLGSGATGAGAEVLAFRAHHLERAARYRRDLAPLDPDVDELVTRAIEMLMAAAADARDRDDLDAALGLLERGVSLCPPSTALHRELLVRSYQCLLDREMVGSLAAVLDQIESVMDDTASPLDVAFLAGERRLVDREAQGDEPIAELVRLAREAGDGPRLTIGLWAWFWESMIHGRWTAAVPLREELERVGDLHTRRICDLTAAMVTLFGPRPLTELTERVERQQAAPGLSPLHRVRLQVLGALAAAGPDHPEAGRLVREAWAAVDSGPQLRSLDNVTNLVEAEALLADDLDRAIDGFALLNEGLRSQANEGALSTYAAWQVLLQLERGDDPDQVQATLDEAERLTAGVDVMSQALVATGRAVVASRRGQSDAVRLAEEAVAWVDRSENLWHAADIRRWLAEVARAAGEEDLARRWLQEAAERYRRKGMARQERRVREMLDHG
jgi:class 3 adenylate cyclase